MNAIREKTLREENLKRHLARIENTPGVIFKKISPSKYFIAYKNNEWFIWPKSSKYVYVKNDEPITDMYWGDVKSFYHRYIAETNELPKNHGKLWSESDISILLDMLENDASLNEISQFLERHPQTIIDRLDLLFGESANFQNIAQDQWDFIIRDIVKIY
ncbi:hypothetical protein QDR63_18690 [Acinetobacter baumannii]|uniref:hypothetical protein n=1 Tax=Acinetobacter baumannii TaxID=470 RepID=UPI0024491F3E|nr:hypothetical protein [Acinetobacter baumannii]MDH2528287.1 hypothetical protein [Acinetobacter baumannii]